MKQINIGYNIGYNELEILCACGENAGEPHPANPDPRGFLLIHPGRQTIICGNGYVSVDGRGCTKHWDNEYGPPHMLFSQIHESYARAITKAVSAGKIGFEDDISMRCAQCGDYISGEEGRDGRVFIDTSSGDIFCSGAIEGVDCETERFMTRGCFSAGLHVPVPDIARYAPAINGMINYTDKT
ncbi:MAG: hypothetical protein R6U32_04755 [Candidatus Woesearchaeota archaeon]